MALSRLVGGWIAVFVWLLLWEVVASRLGNAHRGGKMHSARVHLGEALLLTPLGGLWVGSLGAGGWWLVFGLVGARREWPAPRGRAPGRSDYTVSLPVSLLRVSRTLVAGGLLAWRLAPA
jgi:hypothetical protein